MSTVCSQKSSGSSFFPRVGSCNTLDLPSAEVAHSNSAWRVGWPAAPAVSTAWCSRRSSCAVLLDSRRLNTYTCRASACATQAAVSAHSADMPRESAKCRRLCRSGSRHSVLWDSTALIQSTAVSWAEEGASVTLRRLAAARSAAACACTGSGSAPTASISTRRKRASGVFWYFSVPWMPCITVAEFFTCRVTGWKTAGEPSNPDGSPHGGRTLEPPPECTPWALFESL